MSVGIYDRDMLGYNQIPFNLEAMKLSAYYKKHKEVVAFNTTLEPERYTKFCYCQDFNEVELPSHIFMMRNVDYYGRIFNPYKYSPMPEEMEDVLPDVDIYDIWRHKYIDNNYTKRMFDLLRHSDHVRLSLDSKNVWDKAFSRINFDTTRNTILFHDYDLGIINDAYDAIGDLLKMYSKYKSDRKIGMKFPIQTYDFQHLIKWNNYRSSGYFFNLEYNGILKEGEMDMFCLSQLHTSKMEQFTYNVTPEPIDEWDFYQTKIPYLIRQMQKINQFSKLKLTYNLKYFKNYYIIDLLNAINYYGNYIRDIKIYTNSMYDWARAIAARNDIMFYHTDRLHKIEYLRELYQYVKETNREAFDAMYDRRLYTEQGGKIIDKSGN